MLCLVVLESVCTPAWKKCDENSIRYKITQNIYFKFFIDKAFLAVILIIVLSCMRDYTVGGDLVNYKKYYEHYAKPSVEFSKQYFNYELGFRIVTYVFAKLNLPFWFYLNVISIFFWTSILFLVSRLAKDKNLAILICMCVGLLGQGFSAIRQAIAFAFVIYAFYFIFSKKWWLYFVFITIASLFHLSALILLPLVLVRWCKFNYVWLVCFVGLSIILTIVFPYLVKIFDKLLGSDYGDSYLGVTQAGVFNWIVLVASILLLALCVFVFMRDKASKRKTIEDVDHQEVLEKSMWWFGIGLVVKIISLFNSVDVLQRLLMYFYFSLSLFAPGIVEITMEKLRFKKGLQPWIKVIVGVVFVVYMCFNLYARDYCGVVPFKFI